MRKFALLAVTALCSVSAVFAQLTSKNAPPRAAVSNGVLEGVEVSGIRTFKGVPYAKPPVGDLRWREPQPMGKWTGTRKADKFGPRTMQRPVFGDMNFRSDGVSEDCLYLNVWTPANTATEHLPVLVYFYGGGFIAGDGSEPRYDGESLARRGIVTVTVNYRLNVFGFLAHPELTKESPNHASGNYGLLDQSAAIKWVHDNIAAFGGDPKKITIAGESAGSWSVSAQMASPLSRSNIAGAIGESGALLGGRVSPLAEAEQIGVDFAKAAGAGSLAQLRAMPAQAILELTANPKYGRFPVVVDGYFLPKSPNEIFAAGQQAHVPLLVGWNSQEGDYHGIIGNNEPTSDNYRNAVEKMYGNNSADVLKAYSGNTPDEIRQASTDLASDRFIAFSTWKLADMQVKTGGAAVYRYKYFRPRLNMRAEMGNVVPGLAGGVIKVDSAVKKAQPTAIGAVHSAEIEYALGNLPTNRVYDWQPEDYQVSAVMQAFFANFIKTGNPNGLGVPEWPKANASPVLVMHIDVESKAVPEEHRDRYLLMDKLSAGK